MRYNTSEFKCTTEDMVFSAHERLETCDLVHVNALKRGCNSC